MFTKKTRVISMIATVCMLLSLMASICIPAYADVDLSAYPSVSTVTEAVTEGNYVITNEDDWEYLETNIAYFRSADVVIHLGADIDLSAIEFVNFKNPKFSFDGHGYTVSSWGTAEAPIDSRGMFFVDNADGVGYIKNLNLYDCHGTGGSTCSALLYCVVHSNAGTAGLPAELTIENISMDSCSYTATGGPECVALVLSRYTPAGVDAVVNMRNISIVGSTVTAGNNHSALLIGKPRSDGGTTNTMTYNISDCYLYGNTVNAVKSGNGFIVGTAENSGARTYLNISNVGLIENVMNVTANTTDRYATLIGDVQGSPVSLKGIVLNNNTIVDEGTDPEKVYNSTYLVINGSHADAVYEDIYCDTEISAVASMKSAAVLAGDEVNEAAAYALNKHASANSNFFWSVYDGALMTTELASSMRKIELKLVVNNKIVKTIYAEGGSEVELSYDDPSATFATENAAASIDGNTLTVPTDGSDVLVLVTLGAAGEIILAKSELQESCDKYDGKNLAYYADGLAAKIAEAEALIADPEATVVDAYALKAELDAWGYNTAPNLPAAGEVDTYPDAPGYMINSYDDLQAAKANEGKYTAAQTLYLGADIDLEGKTFAGFGSASKFKFDGMNKTISNWTAGVTNNSISFFHRSNTTSIQNVTFDNAKITGQAHTAIVYGGHASDVVVANRLVIKNVHVKNSTIFAVTEQASIFVTGVQNTRTGGYEIVNCSVVDSKIDASARTGSGNNFSAFVARFTGSWPATSTVVVKNCLADNFDVINGGNDVSVFTGFVQGAANTAEGQVHIFNCVANDCDLAAAGDVGLVTSRGSGPAPQTREVVVNNCTATTTAADTTYYWKPTLKTAPYAGMIYANIDNTPIRHFMMSNEWASRAWYLNGHEPAVANQPAFEARASFFTADAMASGETAYKLNAWSDEYAYGGYWAMDNGAIVQAAKNESTVKVEVQSTSGSTLATYYANSNGSVTLAVEDAVSYAVDPAQGTVNGIVLNLAGTGEDVVVTATLQGAAQKQLYLDQITDLVAYFEGFTAGELTTELAAQVAAAKAMSDSTDIADLEEAALALQAAFEKGAYTPVVTSVDNYADGTAYSVWSKADLEYLSANHAKFNRAGVVIYIAADIDMTGTTTFTSLKDSKIAIDGLGHKIHDWDWTGNAIFCDNYQGGFVKNLTFENVKMAGGYSRAVLFREYKGNDVLIENVNMINVTLDANATGNQMGLYIARTADDSKTNTITIKNCYIKDSSLENSVNGTINNCGIVAGCIKGKYKFVAENIDVIDCENNTETGAGALAFGSIETAGVSTLTNIGVFGGKISVAATAPYVGVLVGMTNSAANITATNCIVNGVDTGYATPAWVMRAQDSFKNEHTSFAVNCVADFVPVVIVANNSTGIVDAEKTLPNMTGVTVTEDLYEAAYLVDRYVSDTAYPSLTKGEGYAETYKITFVDESGENPAEVGAFYTKASGKLSASAASILADDLYNWKFNGADVDGNTVFTADSTVTSNAEHNFNGAVVPEGENTHRVYCTDDDCDASTVVPCTGSEYNHCIDADEDHAHTAICACGNELETTKCEITYTHVDGTMTHTGECSICHYVTAPIACTMGEGVVKPGDEATSTQPGKKTFTCTAGCGNETYETIPQLSAGKVVVETVDMIGGDEDLEVALKFSGNTAPGLNGLVVVLTYDANAMTITGEDKVVLNGFTGAIEITEENGVGTLEIALAAADAVTSDITFATVTFHTTDNTEYEGEKALDVAVSDAGYSATGAQDTTWYELTMEGEGTTVEIRSFTWGDVNRNGDVSIADVVMILRALNGSLTMNQIDDKAANVYTEDNYTENKGVNNADAIALLRYLLNK